MPMRFYVCPRACDLSVVVAKADSTGNCTLLRRNGCFANFLPSGIQSDAEIYMMSPTLLPLTLLGLTQPVTELVNYEHCLVCLTFSLVHVATCAKA